MIIYQFLNLAAILHNIENMFGHHFGRNFYFKRGGDKLLKEYTLCIGYDKFLSNLVQLASNCVIHSSNIDFPDYGRHLGRHLE